MLGQADQVTAGTVRPHTAGGTQAPRLLENGSIRINRKSAAGVLNTPHSAGGVRGISVGRFYELIAVPVYGNRLVSQPGRRTICRSVLIGRAIRPVFQFIIGKHQTMLTMIRSKTAERPTCHSVRPSATRRGDTMRVSIALLAIALTTTAFVGCGAHVAQNLPPSARLLHPGPGVGGPGPGVIQPTSGVRQASALMPIDGVGAGAGGPGCYGGPAVAPTSQIAFTGANGMEVGWDVSGSGYFDSEPLVIPGRQNFPQGAIYRLKLTNIPGRPGVELYPTLEVGPATPRTDAYLAHAPIPAQFTEEDFDQVLSGNYVTKVIYLPDPAFQELALAGVETLVSTRLDPGVDPIDEADRRGSILAILRIGNKDLELPSAGMTGGEVMRAQYNGGIEGGIVGDGIVGDGSVSGMPSGMATSGFAPPVAPPGVVSGVGGPQWGMPFVGTPIGLPGPPHVPLGSPAGLTRHVVKNNTRVHMPRPVDTMKVNVKQRPGMSYPAPVRQVRINEVQRAPLRLFGFHGLSASSLGNGPAAAPNAREYRQQRRAARGAGDYGTTCE